MKRFQTISKAKSPLRPAKPVRVDPPLATTRLSLRTWQRSDREAMVAMFARSRAHLDRWASLHHPGESDHELFERQLRLAQEGDASLGGCRRLGVLDDGTIVGGFNLNQISRGLIFEADANWWIDIAQCRRGFGTRGVALLLAHALGDLPNGLGLHRVTCGIVAGNEASERLARRTGFVHQDGVRSHLQIESRWVRHDIYVASPESVAITSAAGNGIPRWSTVRNHDPPSSQSRPWLALTASANAPYRARSPNEASWISSGRTERTADTRKTPVAALWSHESLRPPSTGISEETAVKAASTSVPCRTSRANRRKL